MRESIETGKTGRSMEQISRAPRILDGKGVQNLLEAVNVFELASGDLVVAGTDIGHDRARQEDRVLVVPGSNFAAVIDGLGGHNLGEEAAQTLAQSLLEQPDTEQAVMHAKDEMLRANLKDAHAAFISAKILIVGEQGQSPEKNLEVFQAGDVKLAVISADGEVSFESKDDSFVQTLVDQGQITADQAMYHDKRHIMMSSVSGFDMAMPKKYPQIGLDTGDFVIAMSDGILLTAEEIAKAKKENNFSARQLFSWIANETEKRVRSMIEIYSSSDREKNGVYSDGYKLPPQADNRSLVIMEIK